MPASVVWFRLDLRLADNAALLAAIQHGGPVIPVFVWAPEEEGVWAPGAASRWWFHQSLQALDTELRAVKSRLVLRRGPSLDALTALVKETGASTVLWSRRYEPALIARDEQIKAALRADGLTVESFNSALLFEPQTVANKAGRPFKVFTPFWRQCLTLDPPAAPSPAPKVLKAPSRWPKSEPLATLELEPKSAWAAGLRTTWQPGESGAAENLHRFCTEVFVQYSENRNRPDLNGTSRLSPHLHFGELGPRQVWHALRTSAGKRRVNPKPRSSGRQSAPPAEQTDVRGHGGTNRSAGTGLLPAPDWRGSQFLAEIGWREFAYHLIEHFPRTPTEPLRSEFARFPWRPNEAWLKAWQDGRTGYPIVDAGMRELWTTGWMHNRVRMIVASFLVKDLLIPWQEGARWFWDTLVDADLASNTLGWQWTAGCGADAAPYFRVFNPVSQGEKFDPNGDYVRRWVPELARLSANWIHRPWEAPVEVLSRTGITLESHYPRPIVSHAIAREVALEAWAKIKQG